MLLSRLGSGISVKPCPSCVTIAKEKGFLTGDPLLKYVSLQGGTTQNSATQTHP